MKLYQVELEGYLTNIKTIQLLHDRWEAGQAIAKYYKYYNILLVKDYQYTKWGDLRHNGESV